MLTVTSTPHRLPPLRSRSRTERGTIAMAMIVLLVCSTLAGVLVVRNVSAGRDGIRQEHRERALGAADVGFAAAEARIAAGASASFEQTGAAGADTWAATVTSVSPTQFTVRVTGTSSSWSRTVAATVQRGPGTIEVQGWRELPG